MTHQSYITRAVTPNVPAGYRHSSQVPAPVVPAKAPFAHLQSLEALAAAKTADAAADARFKAQTKQLTAEWDARVARLEAESARKIEYAMMNKHRAQTAPAPAGRQTGPLDLPAAATPEGADPHFVRSAWSMDIVVTKPPKPQVVEEEDVPRPKKKAGEKAAPPPPPPAPVVEAAPIIKHVRAAWSNTPFADPLAAAAARAAPLPPQPVLPGGVIPPGGIGAASLVTRGMSPLDARPSTSPLVRMGIESMLGDHPTATPTALPAGPAAGGPLTLSAYRLRHDPAASGTAAALAAAPQSRPFYSSALGVLTRPHTAATPALASVSEDAVPVPAVSHPAAEDATAVPRPGTVPTHLTRAAASVAVDAVRTALVSRGLAVPLSTLERALMPPTLSFSAADMKTLLPRSGDMYALHILPH